MDDKYPQIKFSEIKIISEIGNGAFGTVYKSKWREKIIAVKEFYQGNDRDKQRLEIEIRQSFKIKEHLHIINVYGVSLNKPFTYLLLEYADGGSLEGVLFGRTRSEYSTERAVNWMHQCARGVAFLHSMQPKPLLHRDLKPANLLLTKNYEILKICDFGTVAELKTMMTNNRGSVAWMAPEVFNNQRYTEKCDVFSFAIIFWEAITCKEYFRTFNNCFEIGDSVMKGARPKLHEKWKGHIKYLMTTCWDANPLRRPSMADVVLKMKNIFADIIETGTLFEGNYVEEMDFEWRYSEKDYPIQLNVDKETILIGIRRITHPTRGNIEAFKTGVFGIYFETEWRSVIKVYKNTDARRNNERQDQLFEDITNIDFTFQTLHGFYYSQSRIYYHMEKPSVGSLFKVLHENSKKYRIGKKAFRWITDCANGLAYLHLQKLSLNNLTSRNLFINQFNLIKIGHLAIEEEVNFLNATNISAGWMAPEVLTVGRYSKFSDIYSFGVIIWEIVKREIPFAGSEPNEIAKMLLRGIRLSPVENKLLQSLLRICWHENPSYRPKAGEVLKIIDIIGDFLKDIYY